ncbi:MAG: hypothetical protein H6607_03905 [Flavobacteriales bacterium]|nr:hypothetical protein [Flavobacteriales bacterium]
MKYTVFNKVLGYFVIAFFVSCAGYRQTDVTSDAFISQKKWQENYDKYVYLVSDSSHTYRLENVSLTTDSFTNRVSTINGHLNEIPEDSFAEIRNQTRREQLKTIQLFVDNSSSLSPNTDVQIPPQKIRKVNLAVKNNNGVIAAFIILIGLILGIFLGIVILIFFTILTSAGSDSSNSSSSNNSNSNNSSSCYVATMVYGSSEAKEVMILRKYRDVVLLKTAYGRRFVSWYYQNSPKFVERHKSNMLINKLIKRVLDILVYCIWLFLAKK